MIFSWIVIGIGMAAIGWFVWSSLGVQGFATPPTDDPEDTEA